MNVRRVNYMAVAGLIVLPQMAKGDPRGLSEHEMQSDIERTVVLPRQSQNPCGTTSIGRLSNGDELHRGLHLVHHRVKQRHRRPFDSGMNAISVGRGVD